MVTNSADEQSIFFFLVAVCTAQAKSFSVIKSGKRITEIQLNVSLLLVQMEAEESVIYAGMFCDVFRKTNIAIDELKENLPDSVVKILIRLKDYDIEKVGLEDEQCAVLKIAERLHNMRTIEYMEERERQKRAKETIAIFMPIVKKLQDDKLISELNEISINCLK